ncbi:cyclic di-GMP phosphodiesterase Gmr [mine drainage metagenome]|uniref:Cyclic di-GMP phosphodiesterase Gmr n=1 Tax=mine drainage metagenome TaxID=410659 RepID=A0A1J5QGN2_9ZZZZ
MSRLGARERAGVVVRGSQEQVGSGADVRGVRLSWWDAQVRMRVRRPVEMVEATRWLFAVLVLVSLVLALPAAVVGADGTMRLVGGAGGVVLGLSWCVGYLRRSVPLGMDLVDAVALAAFAASSPEPTAAFPLVFAALWFRSLYGSGSRAVLRCGLYVVALGASVLLWPDMPGHTGGVAIFPLIGVIPTMLLTVIVGRHLAGILRARAQAAQLDEVHGSVGPQLLGTTDSAQIREIAWAAIVRICEVTPGLRVMKAVAQHEELAVARVTNGFCRAPNVMPAQMLSALACEDGVCQGAIDGRAALDAAAGEVCAWVCVPLPEVHDQVGRVWLFVGAPVRVPPEALISLKNLTNQVTLALRNSAVHRDLTVLAEVDNLTGLANRASFNAALSRDLEGVAERETTVLFVDLDDFKDVNDAYGHHAGDDLLRVVATRLREVTRPSDLCARIGGDEFAVLLRRTGEAAAAEVAQRVVAAVSTPATLDDAVVHVGASVGVASVVGGDDPETLVHRADVAMYAAKAQGKARVQVFESGLLNGDPSRAVFERDLAAAAANGQLVVHYQPVVTLNDGRCAAVEALVRWQHPERGLLQPDEFIEVAERIGAIGSIGVAVLRQAVADVASWRESSLHSSVSVHVNVSALQLDDDAFTVAVEDCLREFDWPANRLVLEFTETIVISSPEAIDRLRALSASGVQIAIDDFGTGYASLTTLRSLPVQIVKIDKSFIAGSTTNVEDRAVTEGISTMVTRMGLRAIAEGVERPEQRDLLMSIGVREAQGFLYLSPQPAAELFSWLAEHLAVADAPGDRTVIPFVSRHSV